MQYCIMQKIKGKIVSDNENKYYGKGRIVFVPPY